MRWSLNLLEKDILPDRAVRFGIRRLLSRRLEQEEPGNEEAREKRLRQLLQTFENGPIAIETGAANVQHYEVPASFFERVLGPHLKYSSAFWPRGVQDLGAAEAAMLATTVERAELEDGQRILELGCGWGSLTLYMAERFPNARIVAVSNSASQRAFILERAEDRGLENIEVITCDINHFAPDLGTLPFHRVVSVEMFEHVRNHRALLERIHGWLAPGGKLFVHVFCHRRLAYPFEAADDSDWMARYFFTGGIMPSADLLRRVESPFQLEQQWLVDGTHYQKTSEAWLANMDRHRADLKPILAQTYGETESTRWWSYWRTFFMACAELFGYRGGREWLVAHYRFEG